jgi:methylase of polypeptide subunit release factors
MQDANVLARSGHGLRSTVRAATLNGRLYFHTAGADDDAVFFGPDTVRFIGATLRAAAQLEAPSRIVEVGCGAGPAAIELALRFPGAEVVATDVNPNALALAQVNAQLAGARIATRESDVLASVEGEFDVVVSNPPYILDTEQRAYRHGGGMLGAELSLRIATEGLARLRPGGTLLLYTGVAMTGPDDPFLAALRPALEQQCDFWDYEELDPDIFGEQLNQPGYEEAERIAAVFLTARKRMR